MCCVEGKCAERRGWACVAGRGNVRTGQVSSELRSVELKRTAACRRVCVSAALCYTEHLVSQQPRLTDEKSREKERERDRETSETIR